jgi:hypothetical protein
VSVTCEVCDGGDSRWWLTRESGQVSCCTGSDDGVEQCSRGAWCALKFTTAQMCKAYLVMKVRRCVMRGSPRLFLVGQLDTSTWDIVAARVMRIAMTALRGGLQRGGCDGCPVCALFTAISRGGYSCGRSCECSGGYVCTGCGRLCTGRRAFVIDSGCSWLFPHGLWHWWSGVTDARGESEL